MARGQDFLGARLVCRIGVTVDEHDGDGVHAETRHLVAQALDLGLVERDQNVAVGAHALPGLEAQRALDQRHVLLEEQVVGVGPVDAADLVDVAESLGGDQRGLRTRTFEDGVDRDRRAVKEQVCRLVIAAGFLDAIADAVDQPLWCRQRLAKGELAALVVKHRDVGERAADIGSEADVGDVLCARCLARSLGRFH